MRGGSPFVRSGFIASGRPSSWNWYAASHCFRSIRRLPWRPALTWWHGVGWAPAYDPADLDRALQKRELVELRATIRPAEDIVLYRAKMAAWPGEGPLRSWQEFRRDWVKANDACRQDILRRLSASGPLPSRELPDTCAVSWRSTGWTNNRNVTQLLEFMVSRGEVAVAGRLGNERLWDLAERVYPDTPVVPSKRPRTAETNGAFQRSASPALGA